MVTIYIWVGDKSYNFANKWEQLTDTGDKN